MGKYILSNEIAAGEQIAAWKSFHRGRRPNGSLLLKRITFTFPDILCPRSARRYPEQIGAIFSVLRGELRLARRMELQLLFGRAIFPETQPGPTHGLRPSREQIGQVWDTVRR